MQSKKFKSGLSALLFKIDFVCLHVSVCACALMQVEAQCCYCGNDIKAFFSKGHEEEGEKEGCKKKSCTGHLSLTVTNNPYNKFMKRKGLL